MEICVYRWKRSGKDLVKLTNVDHALSSLPRGASNNRASTADSAGNACALSPTCANESGADTAPGNSSDDMALEAGQRSPQRLQRRQRRSLQNPHQRLAPEVAAEGAAV